MVRLLIGNVTKDEGPRGEAQLNINLAPDSPLTIGALATFGVDAGIIDAPGHVLAKIVRDGEGKITGLHLEPL